MSKLQETLDLEGLSQSDLSKESGVNTTTINGLCNKLNKRNTRAKTKTLIVMAINTLAKKGKYTVEDIFNS